MRKCFALLLCVVALSAPAWANPFYVRASGGSDGNTGLSFAQGWATIQYAADMVTTAGSTVLICADGTHSPTTTIDFDTNNGAANNPIRFRGAAADGTDDGTLATISGASISSDYIVYINVVDYIWFENLAFANATSDAIYGGTTAWIGCNFLNCKIYGASGAAIYCNSGGDVGAETMLYRCEIYGNANGVGRSMYSGYTFENVVECSIHDNTGWGIHCPGQQMKIHRCLIYDNGGVGIYMGTPNASFAHPSLIMVSNCTIFGNTGDGIFFNDYSTNGSSVEGDNKIFNTIISGNGGYGINFSTNPNAISFLIDGLCSYGNSSGHSDLTLVGDNIVYEDPNFVSVTDGSENLTPQNSDIAIERAFGAGGSTYAYMGAIQPQASAGGGGAVRLVGGGLAQ